MTVSMQRRRSTIATSASLALALTLGGVIATPLAAHAAAAELFVATTGSDTDPGTQNKPFRTLERARDAVRQLKAEGGVPAGGVTVNIRGGEYSLADSFALGAEDSGTAESPITYRAYDGEDVEIIGGSSIDPAGFADITEPAISDRLDAGIRDSVKQYDLAAHGITEYGEIIQTGFNINGTGAAPELFFNDAVQTLSRYPDTGFVKIASVQNPGADPRNNAATPPPYTHPLPAIFDRGATFTYADAEPDTWVDTGDIWMFGYWFWDWADGNLKIDSIDAANNRITTDTASVYSVKSGQRYYYYNVLEELNTPGEYFIDRTSGTLYFYPPTALEGAQISLSSVTQPLFHLVGASHVSVEGLEFHTSRGDAISIEGGMSDRVLDSTFTNLGGVAVRVTDGTGHGIEGNEVSRTGKGGLVLGGGDRATLTPGGNYARNNVIHDYSRLAVTYNPGIQIDGVGNEASHNEIYNAPHQAIQFTGNDHVIEYNHVHHIVQQTTDSGAIYGVRDWASGGTVIRYNYVHHTGGPGLPNNDQNAIYLDDMLSGIEVYGNVIHDVPRALHIGGGRNNVIDNNIVLGGKYGIQYDNRGEGWAAKHCVPGGELHVNLAKVPFTSPVWQARFPYLSTIQTDEPCKPKYGSIQRNVFQATSTTAISSSMIKTGIVTDNWQTSAAVADLGFVDFAGGDLRLKNDSAVYANIPGFQPIPFQLIGPQSKPTHAGLEIGLDGWTGKERVSTVQARTGFTSYNPTADADVLTHTLGVTDNGTVTMWFYDDAADSSLRVAGNVPATGAGDRALGVSTSDSAATYVYKVDETFTPTDVERTTGWHRFTWAFGNDGIVTMSIDAQVVARVADSPSFTTIEIGDRWADDVSGKVFFDDVSVLAPPPPTLEIGPDTLWQGPHNISTAQKHSGVSSFALVSDKSWLTKDLGVPRDGTVRMWFYDDTADTSLASVGNVPTAAGAFRGIGVNTSISTTHYIYRVDGTWAGSTVPRATGWHELMWTYGTDATMTMAIDGQVIATAEDSDEFSQIQLGDAWVDGKSGAVFFDDVTIG